MKIAIIKLGALGDVLRTTCILAPLKRQHPDAEIWWYTLHSAAPLLGRQPLLTRCIALEPHQRTAFPAAAFDWVLGLDEDDQACRLAGALPARRRFGAYQDAASRRIVYTPDSKPWFDMGLLHRDADGSLTTANRAKQANRRTYPEILFDMLQLPFTQDDTQPVLELDPAEEQWALEWMGSLRLTAGDALIGLNTSAGSRWRTKQMPADVLLRFLPMWAHELPRARWLLLGGPEEEDRHRTLMQKSSVPLMDAGCRHPLTRFASIVNRTRAVITSDSLAMHIAVALRKPTVAFFASTSAAEIELGAQGMRWMPQAPCRCFYRPACEQPRFCLETLDPSAPILKLKEWNVGS